MGNSFVDLTIFPYSKHSWLLSGQRNTLKCESNSVMAEFSVTDKLDSEDFNYWVFRSENKDCLVNTLAIIKYNDLFKSSEINANNDKNLSNSSYCVLIEKIAYRLTDFGAISYQDGLYVLKQGLKAIKVLSTAFSNFLIDEQFIGVNSSGECKYWINSNYFRNKVQLINYTSPNKIKSQFQTSDYYFVQPLQENACNCLNSTNFIEEKFYKNCTQAFLHLLQKIQIRMQPSMSIKQQENYYDIKSKNIDFFSSSHKQNLESIQKFINTLCLFEKMTNNYTMKILPSTEIQNINIQEQKYAEQKSLKKVKSQPSTVFSSNLKSSGIFKKQNIFSNKKFSLKNKGKESGGKIRDQNSIAKQTFKCGSEYKMAQSCSNFFLANRKSSYTKLSAFIQ